MKPLKSLRNTQIHEVIDRLRRIDITHGDTVKIAASLEAIVGRWKLPDECPANQDLHLVRYMRHGVRYAVAYYDACSASWRRPGFFNRKVKRVTFWKVIDEPAMGKWVGKGH